MEIMNCRLCGKAPTMIDDRLVFFVRCENHPPPWPLVYGESYRHLDHIEDEEEAQKAIDSVDWDAARDSAISCWNEWVKS